MTRHSPPLLCAAVLGLSLAALGLAGCRSVPAPHDDDALDWAQTALPEPTNGSLYRPGQEMTLFQNPVAHHVGDIVTIVLNEQTDAQKSAVTTTTKNTNQTMAAPTLLGKPVTINGTPVLSNSLSDASKFDGEGTSKQSNSLTGYITATVTRVLPNGNIYVKGEKWIGINQGREYVRISGVIRPMDLAADNSISSHKVANARIAYAGKGAVADANAQGWLARFFNSPWMPF